ncbi:hypothetical protein OG864_10195 [Streptomyces sp. NBC_00124]|uniref:hypothetical protein n=1 Tax=Streptomyces sp. NBC_00124 TaxID=2975662 RepID=UPI00225C2F58|nr:hypothetical protein [Streptomyces sp. NBC_00124]MCX5359067.1 hypothetical protein [Streptomyces sp. NBC_00124]
MSGAVPWDRPFGHRSGPARRTGRRQAVDHLTACAGIHRYDRTTGARLRVPSNSRRDAGVVNATSRAAPDAWRLVVAPHRALPHACASMPVGACRGGALRTVA